MNSPLSALKARALADIEQHRQELLELALLLHDHPETAMQEHKAAAWLSERLKTIGFSVETGIAGIATAFKASYGQGSPIVAFLAEYDALPQLGHACGHNLIATAAVAAAIGAKPAADECGGKVVVLGTPAEELEGGKIAMLARGAFNGLDAALMLHPAAHDSATIKALACATLDVEFLGQESHAAAHPESGVNALDAMVLSFNAIGCLRQHVRDGSRIHGIITDGGQAANIVPGHTAAHFLVRSDDLAYLGELKKRVLACFEGAATATGATLKYAWYEKEYAPMRNNEAMARLYTDNMAALGHAVPYYDDGQSFGSTDMGNVSQQLPAIHTSVAIAPHGVSEHTPEFARLARQEKGFNAVLQAATALAMTAIDLLTDQNKLAQAKSDFKQR